MNEKELILKIKNEIVAQEEKLKNLKSEEIETHFKIRNLYKALAEISAIVPDSVLIECGLKPSGLNE